MGDGGNSGALGSGNIVNNGTLIFNRSDAGLTVGGAISGNGSLIQNGSGMVTLSATDSYTGPTTIGSGTLQIGNGTTDGSLASSSGINDNGILAYNLVGSQSYVNVISGTGGLYKTGGGTLTLTGSNTYSGSTTINGGVLHVASTAALPGYATTGEISVANGAILAVSAGGSGWADADISALLGGNGGGFAGGSMFGIDTSGGSLSCSSNLAGNMGLTKLGGNALVLTGSNTYAGPTVVIAGTLQAAGTAALPGYTSPGTINIGSGATLAVSAGGSGWTADGIRHTVGRQWQRFCPRIDVRHRYQWRQSVVQFQHRRKHGPHEAGREFAGSGHEQQLRRQYVDQRRYARPGRSRRLAAEHPGHQRQRRLELWSLDLRIPWRADRPGSLGLGNTASAPVALSIGNNNTSTTFAGVLNGAGSLTKVGSGTLLLSGGNNYSGGTVVAAGTLETAGPAALPGYATPGTITVGSGAVLAVSPGGSGWAAADISTMLGSQQQRFRQRFDLRHRYWQGQPIVQLQHRRQHGTGNPGRQYPDPYGLEHLYRSNAGLGRHARDRQRRRMGKHRREHH